MTTNKNRLEQFSNEKLVFRERSHCISCGSSNLHPLWQGKFTDEPTRSFLNRCHYSKDLVPLLAEETFSLVRCETCGMIFHQRILTPQGLNKLYDEWINDAQIEHMEAHYQIGNKRDTLFERGRQSIKHLLRVKKLVEPHTTEQFRILDYGCGDGYFLCLAKFFGFDVYGIDFSRRRSERAAKMGVSVFNNLEALESAQINKVHAVALFQVLEHLEDPLATLRKIATTIADRGILIVEVPDCRGISQPQNFAEFHAVHPLEHINAFTPVTLKKMCEQAGFIATQRIPAHVTTSFLHILRTEISRFIQPNRTALYFQLPD
ncbi:methyltransferase type 12 [Fischerella thermalis CCMEE 5205]|nr:methyltransferase type 12 [Fischerella thermalis CCMEE 5205]